MSRFNQRRLIISLIFLSICGCKKEIADPETLDPIFQDLVKRKDETQRTIEEQDKKLGELKTKLEHAEPNTLELKNIRSDIGKAEKAKAEAKQLNLYYGIHSERRRWVDHLTYKEAFQRGKVWPDPAEYSEYSVNLRLREANRNWGARVPKMNNRVVTSVDSKAASEEKPKKE